MKSLQYRASCWKAQKYTSKTVEPRGIFWRGCSHLSRQFTTAHWQGAQWCGDWHHTWQTTHCTPVVSFSPFYTFSVCVFEETHILFSVYKFGLLRGSSVSPFSIAGSDAFFLNPFNVISEELQKTLGRRMVARRIILSLIERSVCVTWRGVEMAKIL